jgi:predicted RNA binding protein YcfA (HicA-like mRNA interferase family)
MSEKYKVFSSKEINTILKSNGYICTRINKHNIYKNTEGNTITIPRSINPNPLLIRRLFKENNIIY